MNPKSLLLFCLLLPIASLGQSIKLPLVSHSEDPTTAITRIETDSHYTVVSFKHFCYQKGSWVQLNKSMYLQDAYGEEIYKYVKSEGIPLRPEKFTATQDNQEVNFKVYFEKLKPGTKEINIIERARSMREAGDGVNFLNYYGVNLEKSAPGFGNGTQARSVEVVMTPPPPIEGNVSDTTYSVGSNYGTSIVNGEMANFGPMMSSMYTNMFQAQLKIYSDPAVTDKLAKITRNYYNALVKSGFSSDAALKIITSKQLISIDGGSR